MARTPFLPIYLSPCGIIGAIIQAGMILRVVLIYEDLATEGNKELAFQCCFSAFFFSALAAPALRVPPLEQLLLIPGCLSPLFLGYNYRCDHFFLPFLSSPRVHVYHLGPPAGERCTQGQEGGRHRAETMAAEGESDMYVTAVSLSLCM